MGAGPVAFNWKTREIFDVDGKLLYRDKTISLAGATELRIRTAARDTLRTPVWSVKAGPVLNFEGLRDAAVDFALNRPNGKLTPVKVGDEPSVRLICYSYPKLGILCTPVADPKSRVIVDIGDLRVIPLNAFAEQQSPESIRTVWSPFDTVVRTTIGDFRESFKRNLATLPILPEGGADLSSVVKTSRERAIQQERAVSPALILHSQETNVFCAVATAQMILQFYGIQKSQSDIAAAMHTDDTGTTNENQVAGYVTLSLGASQPLEAVLDDTASFSEGRAEIDANHPFKSGISGHARACGGYRIDNGGRQFLYIFDPWPPKQGDIYYEDWSAVYHTNYIYVRPRQFR